MPPTATPVDELIAYHYAGHAVIAQFIGLPVAGVELQPDGESEGACWLDADIPDSPVVSYALVLTIVAGVVAVEHVIQLRKEDRCDSHILGGGMRDAVMAGQLAATLGVTAVGAARKVEALFQRPDLWAKVQAVAHALVVHRTLTAEEVTALVEAPNEPMA